MWSKMCTTKISPYLVQILEPNIYKSNTLMKWNNVFIFRIHVRRSDKINTESVFIPNEKFVSEIQKYSEIITTENSFLNVYVSTDDPSLIEEIEKK